MTTKVCSKCKIDLNLSEFYATKRGKDGFMSWCKQCNNKYRKENYSFDKKKNEKLKAAYGISLAQYDEMLLSQDGKCEICKSDKPGGKGSFCVDHNHFTGQIRGLLCHWCNFMIGQSRESIDILKSGIQYLEKWEVSSQQ